MARPFKVRGSDGADRIELLGKLDFANIFDTDFLCNHLLKLLRQARFWKLITARVRIRRDSTSVASFLLNLTPLTDAVADERAVCSHSWNL